MRALLADHFLAVLRMNANGYLVAHGTGGHKESSFFLENLRRQRLEAVDRGVFTIDVVPDLRLGHGAAHLRRGLRDGEPPRGAGGRKSTPLNSSHQIISYAVFCFEKKKIPARP